MILRDIAGTLLLIAAGVAGGVAIGDPIWAAVLGAVGAGLGAAVTAVKMRWMVALPVLAATIAGGVVGWTIPHRRCLPDSCVAIEVAGAVLAGVGTAIGVGLVVALATRSFDEYHEAVSARRPPPQPGCETDEHQAPPG